MGKDFDTPAEGGRNLKDMKNEAWNRGFFHAPHISHV
jgi:hypothetical protein